MTPEEMELNGYRRKFDYTQFSKDNDVNVIPASDFKRLTRDTFKTLAEILKETYGPYGSTYTLNESNVTTSTKDGNNTFEAIRFSHQYKQLVKLTIGKICNRVNDTVGDGTTSCILLADEIFNKITSEAYALADADEIRTMLESINTIQKYMTTPSNVDGYIHKLNKASFNSVVQMAANHDKKLTAIIKDALNPKYAEDGDTIIAIDNVISESQVDQGCSAKYEILHLPGDYRVRIKPDVDIVTNFSEKSDAVILLYDHNFGLNEWDRFLGTYGADLGKKNVVLNDDGTLSRVEEEKQRPTIIIISTAIAPEIKERIVPAWFQQQKLMKNTHNIKFCLIDGDNKVNEIRDLAAATNRPVHTLMNIDIHDDELSTFNTIKVINNNCLCLFGLTPPEKYIEKLILEAEADDSNVRRDLMLERARALKMNAHDSIINFTAPSTLEQKMIDDQITDCICIIKSAFTYGVVPNLFKYGYNKLNDFINDEKQNAVDKKFATIIRDSIKKLFEYIWESKYAKSSKSTAASNYFYAEEGLELSYDIITSTEVNTDTLATSTQYDVEVINATLDIIKYLCTSRGLIFDAGLLQIHGDHGRYVSE